MGLTVGLMPPDIRQDELTEAREPSQDADLFGGTPLIDTPSRTESSPLT
jgi:hypothetical protein